MWRITVAASLVLMSAAALADDKGDCLNSKDHELRIKGCSALIQNNPKDFAAYYNRGEAYGLKGDSDRAISDYTKAIVLNPNYAPAYNGRGRAYTSKGDYVRAVDDVTRAGELTHKARPRPTVAKIAPTKQKEVAKPPPPVAAKAPVPAQPPTPGKAPNAEKSSVAGKASVVEKPPEGSWQGPWPPWMSR